MTTKKDIETYIRLVFKDNYLVDVKSVEQAVQFANDFFDLPCLPEGQDRERLSIDREDYIVWIVSEYLQSLN